MSAMDMMLQNAMRLLIAHIPPGVMDDLAKTAQTGVQLKGTLERIEMRLAAIEQHLGITDASTGVNTDGRIHGSPDVDAGGNRNGVGPAIQEGS
jgi:hypothetical protein